VSLSRLDEILNALEANYRARLYQARWDEAAAAEIVPQLVGLLGSPSPDIVLRSLRALVTIGPAARGALDAALPYLGSSDLAVAEVAAHAIGCISLRDPGAAVGALVAAFRPGLEKPVMHALLGLGSAAGAAAPVFAQAFRHKRAGVRRLALRGLKEIQAPASIVDAILAQARVDRSREVREYARKLFPLQGNVEQAASRDEGRVTGVPGQRHTSGPRT
jgi:hypothetical protein